MTNPLESLCLQLAHHCAMSRNLPYKVDTTLWKAQELDIKVDTSTLLRYAQRHKVLNTVLAPIPSTNGLENFKRQAALEEGAKSLMLVQWQAVHRKLNQLKIPSLVFKGPALSLQLYGNPYTREYTDLDILVRFARWKEIVEGLEVLGWIPKEFSIPMEIAGGSHHLVFVNPYCPFRLEVHRHLDTTEHHTDDEMEQVFTHMKFYTWNGIELPTLSALDHFELILDHGTKHIWTLMHWLLDGASMLSFTDAALHEALFRKMEKRRRLLQLQLMIRLVTSLFPIEIPKAYQTTYRNHRAQVDRLALHCKERLIGGGTSAPSISHILYDTYFFRMSFATTLQDKLEVGLSLWRIPQQDIEKLKLPCFLYWLHYPLRPFFVLGRRIRRKIHKDIA